MRSGDVVFFLLRNTICLNSWNHRIGFLFHPNGASPSIIYNVFERIEIIHFVNMKPIESWLVLMVGAGNSVFEIHGQNKRLSHWHYFRNHSHILAFPQCLSNKVLHIPAIITREMGELNTHSLIYRMKTNREKKSVNGPGNVAGTERWQPL